MILQDAHATGELVFVDLALGEIASSGCSAAALSTLGVLVRGHSVRVVDASARGRSVE